MQIGLLDSWIPIVKVWMVYRQVGQTRNTMGIVLCHQISWGSFPFTSECKCSLNNYSWGQFWTSAGPLNIYIYINCLTAILSTLPPKSCDKYNLSGHYLMCTVSLIWCTHPRCQMNSYGISCMIFMASLVICHQFIIIWSLSIGFLSRLRNLHFIIPWHWA